MGRVPDLFRRSAFGKNRKQRQNTFKEGIKKLVFGFLSIEIFECSAFFKD
jgi:hypothetical protein